MDACSTSADLTVRSWAFGSATALELYEFVLGGDERDQSRSMMLVLDLLASLMVRNVDEIIRAAVKKSILEGLLVIVAGASFKSRAKSALKALEHLLSKSVFTVAELIDAYAIHSRDAGWKAGPDALWDAMISDVLGWMDSPSVCPVAGKLLVTVFRALRKAPLPGGDMRRWVCWLQNYISVNPEGLEHIKIYVLAQLFKLDRSCSAELLKNLDIFNLLNSNAPVALDGNTLLQLAVIDVGKSAGLVDEPGKLPTPHRS